MNSTAHQYTKQEVLDAFRRLMKLGMGKERAIQLVYTGFPEFRGCIPEFWND